METSEVPHGEVVDIRHGTVYRGAQPVLPDFSLEVSQGCSTVILGPNGSGKSTLMKMFSRELYPVLGKGDLFAYLVRKTGMCGIFAVSWGWSLRIYTMTIGA